MFFSERYYFATGKFWERYFAMTFIPVTYRNSTLIHYMANDKAKTVLCRKDKITVGMRQINPAIDAPNSWDCPKCIKLMKGYEHEDSRT